MDNKDRWADGLTCGWMYKDADRPTDAPTLRGLGLPALHFLPPPPAPPPAPPAPPPPPLGEALPSLEEVSASSPRLSSPPPSMLPQISAGHFSSSSSEASLRGVRGQRSGVRGQASQAELS